MLLKSVALFVSALFALAANAAEQPFPAHRVVGNVYYVGSDALATYLITTPEGHILINSGFEETVPLIQLSVEFQTGERIGHGGPYSTNSYIDTKNGLIIDRLVQHAGFPGKGGESQEAIRQAAMATLWEGKGSVICLLP